jgi:hypothetical protein
LKREGCKRMHPELTHSTVTPYVTRKEKLTPELAEERTKHTSTKLKFFFNVTDKTLARITLKKDSYR